MHQPASTPEEVVTRADYLLELYRAGTFNARRTRRGALALQANPVCTPGTPAHAAVARLLAAIA